MDSRRASDVEVSLIQREDVIQQLEQQAERQRQLEEQLAQVKQQLEAQLREASATTSPSRAGVSSSALNSLNLILSSLSYTCCTRPHAYHQCMYTSFTQCMCTSQLLHVWILILGTGTRLEIYPLVQKLRRRVRDRMFALLLWKGGRVLSVLSRSQVTIQGCLLLSVRNNSADFLCLSTAVLSFARRHAAILVLKLTVMQQGVAHALGFFLICALLDLVYFLTSSPSVDCHHPRVLRSSHTSSPPAVHTLYSDVRA